ncbi:PEGA domain-containing protein [Sorangium sp. So ce385]|uniref:PEGA domain-containing protein n=1 Tax=Sorangium sp. So ce385 TaxID=3133308 RepID=UPI003F5B8C4E
MSQAQITPSCFVALSFLAASLAVAEPSRADPPRLGEGEPPARAEGKPSIDVQALIRVGDVARNQGKWEQAEEAYYLAYKLGAGGRARCEWGMALLALRRHVDAAMAIDRCLEDPGAGTAAQRRRYTDGLERARREVGQIDFDLSHPGALVTIGGEVRSRDASKSGYTYVEPGTHMIKATLPGFLDAEQTVQVEKGKAIKVALRFVEKPKAAPAPARVSTRPATPKKAVARPPLAPPAQPAPPGPFDGMAGAQRLCGIGVTALGLTGGLVASVLAAQYAEEAERRAARLLRNNGNSRSICASPSPENALACAEINDLYDAHEVGRDVATGFFIGAGVVAAATVGSFIFYGIERRRPPVRVVPMIAGDQAGVSVNGVW